MSVKPIETPIEVTWEDQKRICAFSRLHKKILHLRTKEQRIVADLEKLEDAETEVMICDDVKYVFGEAFINLSADEVGPLLEDEKGRLTEEQGELKKELETLQGVLNELKAQLYAKYGSQIYLEDK